MSESIYKVIQLVGSSSTSWEDAAKNAISRASETLRDLRIAEVVAMDIHLKDGEEKTLMLDELEFMKRFACYFCPDYSAEYADISFGGIGSEEGWTTVITRTPVGRAIFADARPTVIEENRTQEFPQRTAQALKMVQTWSARKKDVAAQNRKVLDRKFPGIKKNS